MLTSLLNPDANEYPVRFSTTNAGSTDFYYAPDYMSMHDDPSKITDSTVPQNTLGVLSRSGETAPVGGLQGLKDAFKDSPKLLSKMFSVSSGGIDGGAEPKKDPHLTMGGNPHTEPCQSPRITAAHALPERGSTLDERPLLGDSSTSELGSYGNLAGLDDNAIELARHGGILMGVRDSDDDLEQCSNPKNDEQGLLQQRNDDNCILGDDGQPMSPSPPSATEPTKKASVIQGLLYMIVANFFLSVMALCVRLTSGDDYTSFQLVFVRSFISLIAVIFYTWRTDESFWDPKKIRIYMISRGVFGFLAVTTNFSSIRLLPLSDAVVVTFLVPPFTAIGAYIFLKEKFTKVDALTSFISLAGVILVARPTFIFGDADLGGGGDDTVSSKDRTVGVIYGLCSAAFSAATFVSIRKAGKEAGVWALTGYFSMTAIAGSIVLALSFQEKWVMPNSVADWFVLFGVGSASLFGQLFSNAALQCEKAGLASSMKYTQVVFAIIWELTILHVYPSYFSLMGAGLIISCAGVNIYLKYKSGSKQRS